MKPSSSQWLEQLSVLPDDVRDSLMSIWEFLPKQKQDELQKQLLEAEERIAPVQNRLVEEIKQSEAELDSKQSLVQEMEEKVRVLKRTYAEKDEKEVNMQQAEKALDTSSINS